MISWWKLIMALLGFLKKSELNVVVPSYDPTNTCVRV